VRLRGATGFARIQALRDAVDVAYTSDEAKRRFEIMARQVFIRFKALLMEPSALTYAERHDNIEAIYKKLEERRDTADVIEVLKELHKIVNEAIRAQEPGEDHAEGLTVDLSKIDFAKLRDEFAHKVKRKHAALQDIRDVVERRLAEMLAHNPMRMDYYKKYREIIADYNREKDRVTVEETFAKLIELANSLDAEQRRAAREGLSDDELALFDLLFKENISKADREKVKQASRALLASLRQLLKPMHDWTQNTTTQAEVKIFILDTLWGSLPRPPFSEQDTEALAARVYDYVWERSASGGLRCGRVTKVLRSGVVRPFERLSVRLQAVVQLIEELCDHPMARAVSLPGQFRGQPAHALTGPTQGRLRIPTRGRLNKGFRVRDQRRILLDRPLAPTPLAPTPRERSPHKRSGVAQRAGPAASLHGVLGLASGRHQEGDGSVLPGQ